MYLQNGLLVALVVAAIASVGFRLRDTITHARSEAELRPTEIRGWQYYAVGQSLGGGTSARVVVTMFSDFECPFCRKAAADIDYLQMRYPGEVRVIYRHFPVPGHTYAHAAARAFVCAARQERAQEMYKALFHGQDSLGRRSWTSFAAEAGVQSPEIFERCLNDRAVDVQIKTDSAAGAKLGIRGTPTFLVNSLRIAGNPGRDSLERYVRSALESGGN